MKLFSRGQDANDVDSTKEFEDVELPQRSDFDESFFDEEGATAKISLEPDQTSSVRVIPYGIKNAIELMRGLPRDNNEVVVTVVKQTLESMNVQVEDIVKDAESKESRIRQQHKTLEQEVKNLEAKIADRNQQMSDLMADLKETLDVKDRLELAITISDKDKPAPKPAPAKAPAQAAKEPASASVKTPAASNKPAASANKG